MAVSTQAAPARMWCVYDYKGHRVVVLQQWKDPFGRRMVYIEVIDSDEVLAAGMEEAEFVRDAVPVSATEQAKP